MRATDFDLDVAQRHVQVNQVGALVMLDAVLPHMLAQAKAGRPGHISLVSSVAGYRGLPQSLAYGPTKAALINMAETLYLDLAPLGMGVSIINPGFVETPLTAQNAFKMPALITPEVAAQQIVRGWDRGDFEIHFPKRFTLWLKGLRLLGYGPYFAAVRRSTGM
jgi:NAD(P)-dependent dehydrogenase (short-subunit alcohol dehydrogenase family)